MSKSTIDSSLLDRALIFAIQAHANIERRGKGFPYIVHPLEVVTIISTMTTDQELMAAAALHDVVEDTEISAKTIANIFGERVASLVIAESEEKTDASWLERKTAALNRLRNSSPDAMMIALADKLSNLRTMAVDYHNIGDNLWNRFHNTDKRFHAWRFHQLCHAMESLNRFDAYKEFCALTLEVFGPEDLSFIPTEA